MVCHSLAKTYPKEDDTSMVEWLDANICRCTNYQEIEGAIKYIVNNEV